MGVTYLNSRKYFNRRRRMRKRNSKTWIAKYDFQNLKLNLKKGVLNFYVMSILPYGSGYCSAQDSRSHGMINYEVLKEMETKFTHI